MIRLLCFYAHGHPAILSLCLSVFLISFFQLIQVNYSLHTLPHYIFLKRFLYVIGDIIGTCPMNIFVIDI